MRRELPLVVRAEGTQTQFVHIRIKARPSFTFVRSNEEYSNFTTQIVLVKDARSGDVISTIRQGDGNFVDAYVYLPSRYIGADRRARLLLEGSSPWIVTRDIATRPIEVVSTESTGTADRFQTYELMFGKPDDLPFLAGHQSYAEGAYLMTGSWVFNKFFRYGNDPSSFRLPLEPNRQAYLRLGFYFSANVLMTLNGKEVAIFERSVGAHFFQDFYRAAVVVGEEPAHVMTIANVAPFRATPANLRQMAFAFNTIEIATPRSAADGRFDLVDRLNARLDYRHPAGAREALLRPRNAVASLVAYQGGAWLPARDPVRLPDGARRTVDAVVLLDPMLDEVANTAYASGDVWVNAAAGAAMLLERLGYSVAYATPADLQRLQPRVVYVPSQPFYRNILTPAVLDALAASTATVLVEPSFSGEFINNRLLQAAAGLEFVEDARYVRRDDVILDGQPAADAFQATPVMEYRILDPSLKVEASLAGLGRPIAFSKRFGAGRLAVLAFPAAYYYYNYGLRSHDGVVRRLLREAARPLVFARSASQVRAYVIRQDRCEADLMVENDNVGSFNYYGFAEVTAARPSPTPPPISRVELDGELFAGGRNWIVRGGATSGNRIGERPILHDLAGDTVVSLVDAGCAEDADPRRDVSSR